MSSPARDAVAQAYDEVHYPNFAHRHTDPDRLATIARFHGIKAPPVERCRVLEIGCARGGNLAAIAMALPDARLVGVDLSERQIEEGRAAMAAAGIRNVDLRALDLTEIGNKLGTFDYIIAHGVYSWVSADTQEEILSVFARCLARNGVAYVSYNTRPGWRDRTALRDALVFDTRDAKSPSERIRRAREYLDWLARSIPDGGGAHGKPFMDELAAMRELDAAGLLHEYLGPFHMPVHFRKVVARAARHGLWYLCDAEPAHSADHSIEPEAEYAREREPDELVFAEQHYDFLTNRRFRRTLLCRRGAPLTRTVDTRLVDDMLVSSCGQPDFEVTGHDIASTRAITFRAAQSDLTTGHPVLKAALVHLAAAWPRSLPFGELLEAVRARLQTSPSGPEVDELRSGVVNAFLSSVGVVTLRTRALPCVAEPSDRPIASAWARHLVRDAEWAPSVGQDMVRLDDVTRRLLPLLDGTRDRAALEAELAAMLARGEIVARTADGRPGKFAPGAMDLALRALARSALLVG